MPDHPSSQGDPARLPFSEQIAFFRRKLGNLVPTQTWTDMIGQANDDGFMVSGAAQADLLTDLGAAVAKAIAEGQGVDEFGRDFRDIVRRNGWTGWTGEGSVKGEAWRIRTILRTNASTSYAAGRYAQLKADNFPFWVYRHGGSHEPRKEHLAWNGLVLPPDHEFWATHYPPCDWGCSCYVLGARSEASARRLGGDPAKVLPSGWKRIDPRTGAPIGIGKGWDYAPGASVAPIVQALAAKIGNWDYQVAKAFMGEVPASRADALAKAYRALPSTSDDARRYAQRIIEPKPALPDLPPQRTLGMLTSGQATAIERLTGLPIEGYDFSIDPSGVGHVLRVHGDHAREAASGQRVATAADYGMLPRLLNEAPAPTLAGISDMGEQVVEFRLDVGAETYIARFAVRGQRRRTLALKTLLIKVGK
jgi:hypothetical protein